MTPEQFQVVLRAFVKRRPFRLFLIELISGDRVRMAHPEAIELRGEIWVVVTGPGRRHHVFFAAAVCQLLDPPEPSAT